MKYRSASSFTREDYIKLVYEAINFPPLNPTWRHKLRKSQFVSDDKGVKINNAVEAPVIGYSLCVSEYLSKTKFRKNLLRNLLKGQRLK